MEVESPPEIQDIHVVCDFPDVFPEELPGMPPDRSVEFVIELLPGTAPISKKPYRMPVEELALLKEQIDQLLAKDFIQPSSSPWGCPVLFVKKRDSTVPDRKSTRLNSSHITRSRMPSLEYPPF